ncbi:MAG: DUF5916 domain-containing protein [Balneolaceae bacterium]
MKIFYFAVLSVCLFSSAKAQQVSSSNQTQSESEKDIRLGTVPNPTLNAVRLEAGESIKLDGFLDDEVWQNVPIATGFTQSGPIVLGKPSQRTEVQIMYTDKEIYVGIMAYDTAPDSVIAPLFRRDGRDVSDWVYINIDSYFDRRTAFAFAINPKGVQKDIMYYDDVGEELLWDAVWDGETQMLDNGWSVEVRIPLSQLRFSSKNESHVWGINFQRRIARHSEINFWAPMSPTEPGMVSRFGRLEGIENLKKPRRLEVIPYTSAKLTKAPTDAGNPYYNKNDFSANIGGDIKYGLTSDLTLTATINPDFGQVEADPSTINLSQFETFFSERRPFFLEGSDIFKFGKTKTYNSVGNPDTFYSRRIGRSPQGSLSRANAYNNNGYFDADSAAGQARYEDSPHQTRILGAAKVSGKMSSGTSIGVLYAHTVQENADFTIGQRSLGDAEGSFTIEPKSNYLVTRVKQDINGGSTIFGGFFSGVSRDIQGTYFEKYLHKSAILAGADFEHSWDNKNYTVSGVFSASNVNGTADAILRTQRAPQRYYGRIDSEYLSLAPSKENLGGFATELSFRKGGGEHWSWSVTYDEVSPGYETNDLGYMNRGDYRAISTRLSYRERYAKVFHNYDFWVNQSIGWNYDGDRINNSYNVGGSWRFRNLWTFRTEVRATVSQYDDRLTRGGPVVLLNDEYQFNYSINTNTAKRVSGAIGQAHSVNTSSEYNHTYWVDLTLKPTTNIQLSFEPQISFWKGEGQYIRTVVDPLATQTFGHRYVFSDIESVSLYSSFRINWTFSPKMSLQTYARPYISTGKFSRYKELAQPRTFDFIEYGKDAGTITDNGNSFTINPDGGNPNNSFTIDDRDFNFRSIQGNAVFRWEYKPGSTVFLVWQQQRSGSAPYGDFNFGRDVRDLSNPKPTNVFLIKLSYWLGS